MMLLLSVIAYMVYKQIIYVPPINNEEQTHTVELFTAPILIGLSALTASIAMSRSVYATKISDEAKSKRELYKERIDTYASINKITLNTVQNKYASDEDIGALYALSFKSDYLFNNDNKIKGSIRKLTIHLKNNSTKNLPMDQIAIDELRDIKDGFTSHIRPHISFK